MDKHSKQIELKEIQNISFSILKEVAEFCDRNDIRYFLCGGTLLGAIRHKGFIPWDSDIDIAMPRPDYSRFEEMYSRKGKYRCTSLNVNNSNCFFSIARISNEDTEIIYQNLPNAPRMGIHIDVFPIDGLNDDLKKSIRYLDKEKFFLMLINNSFKPIFYKREKGIRTIFAPFISVLSRIIITKKVMYAMLHKIEREAQQCCYDTSKYVTRTGSKYKFWLPHEVYSESVEVEFEGEFFKAPVGYHEYLTTLYGAYMNPPPAKDQKPSQLKAYWIGG